MALPLYHNEAATDSAPRRSKLTNLWPTKYLPVTYEYLNKQYTRIEISSSRSVNKKTASLVVANVLIQPIKLANLQHAERHEQEHEDDERVTPSPD